VAHEGVSDLQRHLPHLEVFDVSGAGHIVAGDKSDAFNKGGVEFLKRSMPPSMPAGQVRVPNVRVWTKRPR